MLTNAITRDLTISDGHSNGYCDSNGYCNSNGDGNSYTYGNGYTDGDSYCHCYRNSDSHANGHGNRYAYAHADLNSTTYTKAKVHPATETSAYSFASPVAAGHWRDVKARSSDARSGGL